MKNQVDRAEVLAEFCQIPGVGKRIAEHFWDMGLRSYADFKDASPEALYERMCKYKGYRIHRCMLYIFRCAVYCISTERPKPSLMKWWNWKDR